MRLNTTIATGVQCSYASCSRAAINTSFCNRPDLYLFPKLQMHKMTHTQPAVPQPNSSSLLNCGRTMAALIRPWQTTIYIEQWFSSFQVLLCMYSELLWNYHKLFYVTEPNATMATKQKVFQAVNLQMDIELKSIAQTCDRRAHESTKNDVTLICTGRTYAHTLVLAFATWK